MPAPIPSIRFRPARRFTRLVLLLGPLAIALAGAPAQAAIGGGALLNFTLPGSAANLGSAVTVAGDVNGDGYSDLIVGAPKYSNGEANEGEALLFLGGPSGFSNTPDWTYESDLAGADLGQSVAPAGDVNGDGYADVIVGAPNASTNGLTNNGRAYVFLGGPSGLAAAPAWTLDGTQGPGENLGFSVCTAGDVNGDGYDDVIVGSPGYTGILAPPGAAHAASISGGRAQVFLGGPSGLAVTAAWSWVGYLGGGGLGYSVSTANDVNGDGYDDVVVGVPYATDVGNSGPAGAGEIEVFLGGYGGLTLTPVATVYGDNSNDNLGFSVAGAGDVDGDGYADIVVGAPGLSSIATNQGEILVFRGNAGGITTIASFTDVGPVAMATLPGGLFGFSVAPAGDVNGDGLADFIAGAPHYSLNGVTAIYVGYAALYEGTRGSPIAVRAWSSSSARGSQFGASVCAAGDGEADGFGDLTVGSPTRGGSGDGYAQVFRGAADTPQAHVGWKIGAGPTTLPFFASAANVGDTNGDGYDDLAVAIRDAESTTYPSALDLYLGGPGGFRGTPDWSANADALVGGAQFVGRVTPLGDVNGDGYSDFIVDDGYVELVLLGSASGPVAQPDWVPDWGASIPRAPVGDVNGDGYDDAIFAGPAGLYGLFLGSPTGLSTTPAWTANDVGGLDNLISGGVAGVGDFDGDGYGDVLFFNGSYDGTYSGEGDAVLYRGNATGLESAPSLTMLGSQATQHLGSIGVGVGDVNGDGFADFIVQLGGFQDGGGLYGALTLVYGGGATPAQSITGTAAGFVDGSFGRLPARAGDVNGDGYDDVVVLSEDVSTPTASSQAVMQLFLGSPTGLVTPAAWTTSWPGVALSGPTVVPFGPLDANGDGFPDLAAFLVASNESTYCQVFHGNAWLSNSAGLDRGARQRRASDGAPISLLGLSGDPSSLRLSARGRSAVGRTRTRLQSEARNWGVPFAIDLGTLTTGAWAPTADPTSQGSFTALDLLQGLGVTTTPTFKWRARVQAHSPYFPWTPWLSPSGNGRQEFDLRTRAQSSALAVGPSVLPRDFSLSAPTPNPSRGGTTLAFQLPRRASVDLSIFDVSGRRVAVLADGPVDAGEHTARWDGRDLSGREADGGVYFARLVTSGRALTRKLVRVR